MKFIIDVASTGAANRVQVRSEGAPSNTIQHIIARMIIGVTQDLFGGNDANEARIIDALSDSNPLKPLAIAYSKMLHTPSEDITAELMEQFDAAIEQDLLVMQQELAENMEVCGEPN